MLAFAGAPQELMCDDAVCLGVAARAARRGARRAGLRGGLEDAENLLAVRAVGVGAHGGKGVVPDAPTLRLAKARAARGELEASTRAAWLRCYYSYVDTIAATGTSSRRAAIERV